MRTSPAGHLRHPECLTPHGQSWAPVQADLSLELSPLGNQQRLRTQLWGGVRLCGGRKSSQNGAREKSAQPTDAVGSSRGVGGATTASTSGGPAGALQQRSWPSARPPRSFTPEQRPRPPHA